LKLHDRITTEQNSGTFRAYGGRNKQSDPVVQVWILQRDAGQSSASKNFDGSRAPRPENSEDSLESNPYTPMTVVGLDCGGSQLELAESNHVLGHVQHVIRLAQSFEIYTRSLPVIAVVLYIWVFKEPGWECPVEDDCWYSPHKGYWSESKGFINTTFAQRGMCSIPVFSKFRDETSELMDKVTISDDTPQLTTNTYDEDHHAFLPSTRQYTYSFQALMGGFQGRE